MRTVRILMLCAALTIISGCKKEDKTPPIKSSEPKTSYGKAIDGAKKAVKATEDTQKREAEALSDDDSEEPGEN